MTQHQKDTTNYDQNVSTFFTRINAALRQLRATESWGNAMFSHGPDVAERNGILHAYLVDYLESAPGVGNSRVNGWVAMDVATGKLSGAIGSTICGRDGSYQPRDIRAVPDEAAPGIQDEEAQAYIKAHGVALKKALLQAAGGQ